MKTTRLIVKVTNIDHHGLNGREFYPQNNDQGCKAVVVKTYYESIDGAASTMGFIHKKTTDDFEIIARLLTNVVDDVIQLFDCIFIDGPHAGEPVTLATWEVEEVPDPQNAMSDLIESASKISAALRATKIPVNRWPQVAFELQFLDSALKILKGGK